MTAIIIFGIGLLAGMLAFWLGKWRTNCIFWTNTSPVNVPRAWRLSWVPIVTWMVVAILSVVYATLWSGLVIEYVNYWLGVFLWGSLLALRWQVSGLAAARSYHKDRAELDAWMARIEAERSSRQPRTIEQLMGVPMTDMTEEELKVWFKRKR